MTYLYDIYECDTFINLNENIKNNNLCATTIIELSDKAKVVIYEKDV